MRAIAQVVIARRIVIELRHVKGHQERAENIKGTHRINIACDALAKHQRRQAENAAREQQRYNPPGTVLNEPDRSE